MPVIKPTYEYHCDKCMDFLIAKEQIIETEWFVFNDCCLCPKHAPKIRVFVCTDHAAVFPTGVASIVVASSREEAYKLLKAELHNHPDKLDGEDFTLQEVNVFEQQAIILKDGDY